MGEDIDARRERRRWARNEQDDQLRTQLVFIKERLITSDDLSLSPLPPWFCGRITVAVCTKQQYQTTLVITSHLRHKHTPENVPFLRWIRLKCTWVFYFEGFFILESRVVRDTAAVHNTYCISMLYSSRFVSLITHLFISICIAFKVALSLRDTGKKSNLGSSVCSGVGQTALTRSRSDRDPRRLFDILFHYISSNRVEILEAFLLSWIYNQRLEGNITLIVINQRKSPSGNPHQAPICILSYCGVPLE